MKKTQSLKTKIVVVMLILLVFQSIAMLSVVVFSNVLTLLDSYALRFFESASTEQVRKCNAKVGTLVENVSEKTELISEEVKQTLSNESLSKEERYERDG